MSWWRCTRLKQGRESQMFCGACTSAYVGDQNHDLRAARNAGLLPIRVTWCGMPAAPGEHVCHLPIGLLSPLHRSAPTSSDHTTELLTPVVCQTSPAC